MASNQFKWNETNWALRARGCITLRKDFCQALEAR